MLIPRVAVWGLRVWPWQAEGFSPQLWATQPVVSLLWSLMPCSVHVGCINAPACPNTLQMWQSLGLRDMQRAGNLVPLNKDQLGLSRSP